MALVLADRVKETTTTTSTGTYTLGGAVTGFESFSVVGNGNTTYYCCTDGTDFEVGVGTYASSGTTLARTTILQSSNSDSEVNWSTGTRDIFITQPAEKAVFLNADGHIESSLIIGSTDDGAGNAPTLDLYRHSGSPADSDHAGTIQFNFQNDADQKTLGGRIYLEVDDVSDGSEDGAIKIAGLRGGSEEEYLELAFGLVRILSDSLYLPSGKTILFEGSTNDTAETTLTVTDPTTDRTIALPDRDGMVRVVDQQTMTANLAVGWHTIAVFQGRDDSPQGSNQRFHAKFSLIDITSSRHQAMTFYAQSMFGQDEGLQIIGNSTFGTDVVTAIRIKSSTNSSNGLYAGAVIQIYVANATNNLILFLDEANLDNNEGGVSYGNVILKTGVADASDPGDVGYSSAGYSTFAEDVQIATDSIEPGGIGVTGNLLTQSNIVLEGATADAHETIITATDATADRTITLPDATGTVQLTDGSGASLTSLNASELGSGTVPNARLDAQLQDVAGLAVTNGNFIVGDGANFVAESGSTARTSLGLGTAAVLDTGISNTNVPKFTSGVVDDDFLRVNGTDIEGRSASEVLSDIGGQASLTFGISNTNAVKIDSSSVADDEYARFTANGLESRSTSEVLSDIGGQASLTFGISNTNAVKIDSSSVADDEFARFTASGLESRSASEVRSDIGLGTAAVAATGISNGNVPVFTSGVADDDFLRVNGTSIEGRSATEVVSDLGLGDLDFGLITGSAASSQDYGAIT